MSQAIILSLSRDDVVAQPIADAMIEHRLDIWWEQVEPSEPSSFEGILERVDRARAVVLIWSGSACDPAATLYQDLAAHAVAQLKAIHVIVEDGCKPPLNGAGTIYRLSGWRTRPGSIRRFFGGALYLRDVVTAAQYKIAGRDPPPPNAPRNMLLRQMAFIAPAMFAVIALIPTLIGLWVDLGLSAGPSQEEEALWARAGNSCPALRTLIQRFPDGYYADQAPTLMRTMPDGSRRPVKFDGVQGNM
ncbi:hypothetical protein M2341_000034 [Sphingobium sp. B7D2B]|uniref:hypothetical protein n=1 Tax=Sphingobium sp. B7D2B TaxID=2940583 RepID=UPI002223F6AC|nr:hypothetical protein [Sphingobium sp. B7D2B]MCW2364587.1 hypothetical protein [Sphingobium sp. B7D2B]